MRYTHIFWDWNGTLLDDAECAVDCVNATLKKHGLPEQTLARYLDMIEYPLDRYYAKLFNPKQFTYLYLLERFQEEYALRADSLSLNGGAKNLLFELQQRGCRQYIVSAFEQSRLLKYSARFGIADCFECISGADDITCGGKVQRTQALLEGIDKQRAVYIGDTVSDYEVAQQLGIDCILCATGHQAKRALCECRATAVVNSLSELPDILF